MYSTLTFTLIALSSPKRTTTKVLSLIIYLNNPASCDYFAAFIMNQQQPSRYVAKHAFQGNVAQSQLSFPSGAIIVARPNQEGAWWWGNCNGREGWFPPGYVAMAPAAVSTPMPAGAGSGMPGVLPVSTRK